MYENKILDLEKLSEICRDLQEEGKKVVHCHGVFDLLHVGHIRHFEQAKKFGDALVVTITQDKYVNKGPHRPAFTENLRAEAIAALGSVDYVAINKWPTAIETIKTLKPNLYVKGPDYKDYEQDVTGNIRLEEDAVKSVGGKIVFTSGITFSSSYLINEYFSQLDNKQKAFLEEIKDKYTFDDIVGLINELLKLKVLLVGEVIIDEYVFCDTIGKSGKEPVLVNRKLNTEKYAGGVLAVANHVSDFCKEVKIISYLGDRDNQKQFIKENMSSNIDMDYVLKSNSPTILKTRFVDNYSKTKIVGVYDINDGLLNESEEAQLCSKLENSIADYDVIIVTDYGHGLITPKVVKLLEEQSKYLAVNTQLNAANIGFYTISKYNRANYLCVHEGELRHDYRNRTDTVEDLTRAMSERIKSDVIVITQGNKGSMVFENNRFIRCPAFATKVIDRVGAGDSLLAITALCFAAGLPADLTLFIGNLAAAEKVAYMGNKYKIDKVKLLKSIESLLR